MDVFRKYKIVWIIFIAVVIFTAIVIGVVLSVISKNGFMMDSCVTNMSTEYSIFNSWNMKYGYLNGTKHKNIKLNSGDELTVDYSSVVKKGSLEILLLDTDKHKIKNLLEDNSGKFKYTANKSGKYYLKIVGDKTEGQFNLHWNTKSAK